MKKPSLAFAPLLFVLLAACSAAPDPTAPGQGTAAGVKIGKSRHAIINGEDSDSTDDSVVLIIHFDRSSYGVGGCTGTLIAPNVVLTARHCVSEVENAPFGCNGEGKLVGGSSGGKAEGDHKPSDLYIFTGNERPSFRGMPDIDARGAKIVHTDKDVLCTDDIALIVLDTKLTDKKISPLRLKKAPRKGEKITAVGWGVTTKSSQPSTRQKRTGVKIDTIGPFEGDGENLPVPPNNFQVGESICSGDSGGPAFSESTGAVLGVVSRGGNGSSSQDDPSAGCVDDGGRFPASNSYIMVSSFAELIENTVKDAGYEVWEEGEDNPNLTKAGEDCDKDKECGSGVCLDGACAASCNDDRPCDDEESTCKSADDESEKTVCMPKEDKKNKAEDEGRPGDASSGLCTVSAPGSSSSGVVGIGLVLSLLALKRRRRG